MMGQSDGFEFVCPTPGCGHRYRATPQLAGKTIQCKSCKQKVKVSAQANRVAFHATASPRASAHASGHDEGERSVPTPVPRRYGILGRRRFGRVPDRYGHAANRIRTYRRRRAGRPYGSRRHTTTASPAPSSTFDASQRPTWPATYRLTIGIYTTSKRATNAKKNRLPLPGTPGRGES
jgi:hypothetical protein